MQKESLQDRRLVKTATPGVYKRGNRYVVVFRDPHGRQRKAAARTLAEARELKATLTAEVKRGEYMPQTKLTLQQYFDTWISTYRGRTRAGIRQNTLDGYSDQMRVHILPRLGRRKLAEIGPRDIKQLAADLYAQGLSANSVRLAIAPLKVMLACAFEEELIRRNPAANVRIVQPTSGEGEQPRMKALSEDEVQGLLAAIPESERLVAELLVQTGLRIGELLALTWGDIDFGKQRLHVRRRYYRGSFAPPKSKYGKRQVPLSKMMAQRLWRLRGADDQLVFATKAGTPLDATNHYNRVFKPAACAAGVPHATFHTLRHTCASILFNKGGLNPKQVQAWLGHHAASFTLDTYVHLLEDDVADAPAALDQLVAGATPGQSAPQRTAEIASGPKASAGSK